MWSANRKLSRKQASGKWTRQYAALLQDRNAGLSDARARGEAIAAQFLNRAVAMEILTPSASVGLRLPLLHDLV